MDAPCHIDACRTETVELYVFNLQKCALPGNRGGIRLGVFCDNGLSGVKRFHELESRCISASVFLLNLVIYYLENYGNV